jgi:hypothetical protein
VVFIAANDGAHAAGASFLNSTNFNPPERGRRGGMDRNRGDTTSFRVIDDATKPDTNSTNHPQIHQPRLTLGAVLGDGFFNLLGTPHFSLVRSFTF